MRGMKDSGVEWIGEIPKDWETGKTLYALSMPITDGPHETPELIDEGIPFVSAEAVSCGNGHIDFEHIRGFISQEFYDECCKKYIPQLNDVYMIKSGATTGKVAKVETDKIFTIWSPLAVFRVDDSKYYYEYLYYFIQSDGYQKQIENKWTYGTQQNIGMRTLEKLFVCFPPLTEQRKIADYLDAKCSQIDTIIAKQQTIIEKLKKYKLAVITEAVTKGIKPDVEMKECHIRKLKQIPINWDVIKITRILDYESSYPIGDGDHGLIKTENYKEEGIPYIRVQNLGWGTDLLLDNVIYISQEDHDKIKGSELHPNDILFCKTGATIGKTGMIPDNIPISNTTSHVGKITIDKKYNPRFVFYYLSSFIGYVQFWDIACMKSTRPELSIEEIRAIMIAIPRDREEQDVIVQYLDKKCAEIERIIANKEEIKSKLLEYKKSLIYEVVTGKKEV